MSSKSETRYASAASCKAITADDWKRRSVYKNIIRLVDNNLYRKKTHLEILCDFTDEALEGELADEELSGLLVATDFTKSNCSGPEAMWLLDTTSCSLKDSTLDQQ